MHAPLAPSSLSRLRRGFRQTRSWLQLARFGIVGASGYVVNLATFAVAVSLLHLGHRAAATLAFCVAVSNNFAWNRHWTFRARGGDARRQAVRFLTVSVVAFLGNLAVLEVLVSVLETPELAAQAIAVVAGMPLNFVGNKLWTFDA